MRPIRIGNKAMAVSAEKSQAPVKQCKRSVKPVFHHSGSLTFGAVNRIGIINFGLLGILVLAGLLAIQAVRLKHTTETEQHRFSENVNLALRRTAHRLLAMAGNRTGAIPPVEETESSTWTVSLEQHFDYDSLPNLLRESFALQHITGNYNVMLVNCQSDDLMLGYAASTFDTLREVPCSGRDQTTGCYNLRVSFPDRAAAPAREKGLWLWLAGIAVCLVAFVSFAGYNQLKKNLLTTERPLAHAAGKVSGASFSNEHLLAFGQSTLDISNQKLLVKNKAKNLTYREAKLLHFFGSHAGQLLTRDLILQSVWKDEGILVGRSVDVFVSRLRKLLKDDETLRIANVHGIGYRLEINRPYPVT